MPSNTTNIKKLQRAINLKGENILYNTNQGYSEDQNRPVTVYSIKKAVWDDDKQRTVNIELFKSTSQIQVLLYLRDYWFKLNGREIPSDNAEWNKRKELLKIDF